ncbi:MAG: DUF1800 domain-containing protein [Burkholderiales bacterium]|nr:DUF1800 domain-containing protein [Burkholderiales bacterium]
MQPIRHQPILQRLGAAVALAAGLLAAGCGGGEGDATTEGPSGTGAQLVAEMPQSRADAARFLTQATFGPTDADVDRVMAIGYAAWIDEQLGRPASGHRAYWEAANAAIKAANAGSSAGQDQVLESFWKSAVAGDDQLRQRAAYALSQIFVISMQDGGVGNDPRAVAAWLDMLATQGLGKYRDLLEAVSRHPLMGVYLSHLRNQKADPRTGRVPDENYAREVMQLFSIGLVELNADGTARVGSDGRPLATYGPADIAGLAKVFTGWSWACADWPDNGCFSWGSTNGDTDPDRAFKSMLGYPQYHSAEEKKFLGATVPAQSPADPQASLRLALDTLAAHPNVGPFIGRQLIQRLVTSNPSPQYVAAVGAAFNASGGDMAAMLKTVLMHPEARRSGGHAGKVREPVLRLSAFLRAFGFKSDSGGYKVGNTDSAASALGQAPLRSPSVFNFYRPGYVPPGTESGALGLAVPELQIAHETSAAGYVNYMRDSVASGVGQWNSGTSRRDLQGDFSAELGLAEQVPALVDRLDAKLFPGGMPEALKAEIVGAVEKIAIPAPKADGSNARQVNDARRARVNAAIFLAVVSPEFLVQK